MSGELQLHIEPFSLCLHARNGAENPALWIFLHLKKKNKKLKNRVTILIGNVNPKQAKMVSSTTSLFSSQAL